MEKGFSFILFWDVELGFNPANWGRKIRNTQKKKGFRSSYAEFVSSCLKERSVVAGGQKHKVDTSAYVDNLVMLVWSPEPEALYRTGLRRSGALDGSQPL